MTTLTDFIAIDYPDGRSEVTYIVGQSRIMIATARGQSARELARKLRLAARDAERATGTADDPAVPDPTGPINKPVKPDPMGRGFLGKLINRFGWQKDA